MVKCDRVQEVVKQSNLAKLVESNVRFTRADNPGDDILLCQVYIQRQPRVTRSAQQIRADLTKAIQTRLLKEDFKATPLVDVTVLEAPPI